VQQLLPYLLTNSLIMSFWQIYTLAFVAIMILMTTLWIASVILKNVSIVDMFWGFGFVLTAGFYFLNTDSSDLRKIVLLLLVALWGLRLSLYLAWRNIGKGEDFRYRKFRQYYGEKRYWWISFFQTFLLQGVLMWLISAPLLGAMLNSNRNALNIIDFLGIAFWIIGFLFESGGDFQLARFRSDPGNKGKVLDSGFWHYTRHPNYFGDSSVWWGFGLICIGTGSYLPVLGSLLMTALIIKVSGVALLEKSLKEKKPEYQEYIRKTSAFIPWFPKK
jgi:steroid 5-alpha reductase family enzyme